ncbi:Z1 domain-containing protein [Streptomyces sp. 2132.2]|uniref:Z1 domain-containing protein n=1 Tax=Streptomyces sp. 2132.2 TaxID=2485161 RepID=UPI000F494761|nr:Z1 domain-containing protein [Streptomyces sp. 2132.2]ROQ96173.1 Z1 domain-containing protein [Streptomyces sp. 2132.2]
MSSEDLKFALDIAEAMVMRIDRSSRTSESLLKVAEEVHGIIRLVRPGVAAEDIARALEKRFNVWAPREVWVLDPDKHNKWLGRRENDIEWRYWDRYKNWLLHRKGWKPATVETLSDSTNTVLSLMEDPGRPGSWLTKGLTYGQVQSGKTANYTGLVCKAVDAGYRVVIVLTGAHESLRHQTQARLDLEFLGFDTRFMRERTAGSTHIGVGNLDMKEPLLCMSMTTQNKDFNSNTLESTPVDPRRVRLLAVVKKNARILENLRLWLEGHGTKQPDGKKVITDLPLLIIDDEADYASVDTKKPRRGRTASDPDHDPTAINRSIREILGTFEKRAYVAYTATPFANIFISNDTDHPDHGDDLFPSSFIVALNPPSNYCGPETVFGLDNPAADEVREPLPVIRIVEDEAAWLPDDHTKDHEPAGRLPMSLIEAVDAFVLSTATRKARTVEYGVDPGHNTMLVHVTRYRTTQVAVARQITSHLREMDNFWGDHGAAGQRLRGRLRELWERDHVCTYDTLRERSDLSGLVGEPVDFEQVLLQIPGVLEDCVKGVKTINGLAADVLEYESSMPATVIAVGGDKLSRGLTLEGLTVSYYLRSSRTYDTLMQMGRWFGYRNGYLDVTRLYTTKSLVNSFVHVTRANRELIDLVSFLAETNKRPADVGLRILDGYEKLQVTAAAKMRSSRVISLSSAGQRPETLFMRTGRHDVAENYARLERLVEDIEDCDQLAQELRYGSTGFFRTGVPARVVTEFLDGFSASGRNLQASPSLLKQYIENQVARGELTSWTVAVTAGASPNQRLDVGDGTFRQVTRSPLDANAADQVPEGADFPVGVLVSPGHEAIGIPLAVYEQAMEATRLDFVRSGSGGRKPVRPSGRQLRRHRDAREGLLLVYPVDATQVCYPEGLAEVTRIGADGTAQRLPLVGYALSLPMSGTATSTKFRVNEIYLKELQGMAADTTDEMEDA